MTAKIICATWMFLASTSSAFAEARRSMVTGHAVKALRAAGAVPAVEHRQDFIKRRLRITC